MAGSYPDAPSRRMAYDADGTVVFLYSAISGNQFGTLSPVIWNNEAIDTNGVNHEQSIQGQIWPEERELDGLYWNSEDTLGANNFITLVEESDGGGGGFNGGGNPTTNGVDGAWNTVVADADDQNEVPTRATPDSYRQQIEAFAVSDARAFRQVQPTVAGGASRLRNWHVYGTISPGQTPDRLAFIDEATGLPVGNPAAIFGVPIDYGDRPRGSLIERDFLIENLSATLTAVNPITLSAEDLETWVAFGTSMENWITYSDGGGPFSEPLSILVNIGPSSRHVNTITARMNIPDDAELSLHAARIRKNVSSWI